MKLDFAFVPFPREIWTEGIELTQAEFRLLGWFCCNLKFGIPQPDISDEQIIKGFDSEGIHYPSSGLSKRSLYRARIGLDEKGFLLSKKKIYGGGRGNEAIWSYSLNLANSARFTSKLCQNSTQTLPTCPVNSANLPPYKGIEEAETTDNTLSVPTSPTDLVLSGDEGKFSNHQKKKTSDPRHAILRDKLEKFWGWLNPNLKLAWGPSEAGQLGKFLKDWPELTPEEFRIWLLNYSDSDEVVTTKTPKQFLPHLHEYANSPLNKYHKPKDEHAQT